ncbi:MAG: 30S ribosomal protein S20 [Chloroflexi bacterium]|nr:30S ribosomal protein S20 [Chloroflexota bacterium]
MANIKSAIKQMRQNEKRRARNRMVRSSTRTAMKKANILIASGDEQEATDAVRQAISALDKAAQKGVIHPNNAARHKSRLMKKLEAAK